MTSRLLLTFAVVCAAALGAPTAHVCKSGNIVNRPSNNETFSFPSKWNESESAPHLAAEQSCSWVFTVPKGYFAKLIIDGKINDTVGHFQMIDTAGNVVQTKHENKEPYYFPTPKFTLIMENEAPAKFGFKVIWMRYPDVSNMIASISGNPHIVNITQDVFSSAYASQPHLSLLAFPADPKNSYTLRSVLVFNTMNLEDGFVNNLQELNKLQHQYISPADGIYVINVEARNAQDKLLVQSSSYTYNLNPYNELNCKPNSTCSKKLNGEPNQQSAFVSIAPQKHTLLDVQMDTNATLSVYHGGINNFGLYGTYDGTTIKSKLPLDFHGGSAQYVISSGPSIFTFHLSDKKINN